MADKTREQPAVGCELCGDFPKQLYVHSRCHPAAPLRGELSDGVLTLFCYVPDCNRRVASFKISEIAR